MQPHSAILKGESFERIIIKNATKLYFPNLVVRVYSSATVWEFVDKVTRMCELAPQYADVMLSGGKRIKDTDYGKTLGEMGMRNHDIITVKRNKFEEDIPHVSLIDPATKELTDAAHRVFDNWYDKYSDQTGVMTP